MKTLDLVFANRNGVDTSPLLEALDGNIYTVQRMDNGNWMNTLYSTDKFRYVLRDEKTGNWCTAPLRSEAMDIVLDNRGMVPAP